jgi:hypothetical protein
MKVNKKIIDISFKAIELTITIETEEEAQALYAIFNFTHNRKLLKEKDTNLLLDEIGKKFYIGEKNKIISNNIAYKDYYKSVSYE